MNVKKILPLSIIVMSALYGANSFAGEAEINFTGKILDAGCTVDNTAYNVDLGQYDKGSFSAAGDRSALKDVKIQLTDCPSGDTVSAVLSAPVDDKDSSLVKLSDDSSATGVGIGVYDSTDVNTPLALNTPIPITLDGNHAADLDYKAAYVATGETVAAGNAAAKVEFNLTYN